MEQLFARDLNAISEVLLFTEEFLTGAMENADGPLPPAGPEFYQRFGGLQTDA